MSAFVVDTNVPLTANRFPMDKTSTCPARCVVRLKPILSGEAKFVIDSAWRILNEYKHKLQANRGGFGDLFLKHVLTNHTNPDLCEKVDITPTGSQNGGENYAEFPESPATDSFDWPDRKFVAVSNAHAINPPILQASDCKWLGYYAAFGSFGVRVIFVCHDEAAVIYVQKMGVPAPPVAEEDRG